MNFAKALAEMPLIAILRGVLPAEVEAVAELLIETGIRTIEVPLNSPQPYESIEKLSRQFSDVTVIGAGTVLSAEQVGQCVNAGASLVLAPNMDVAVIREAGRLGAISMPGVATATEAIQALSAGAGALKVFPAAQLGAGTISAWKEILPEKPTMVAVGGVTPSNAADFLQAGAGGIGVGGSLYRRGATLQQIGQQAQRWVEVFR